MTNSSRKVDYRKSMLGSTQQFMPAVQDAQGYIQQPASVETLRTEETITETTE